MRPLLPLAVLALATPAYAGSHTSGGDRGGRLSQVSAGISHAVASAQPTAGNTGSLIIEDSTGYGCAVERGAEHCPNAVVVVGAEGIRRVAPSPEPSATVEGYAGAQKVFESDGSVSLGLSVVDDRIRLNAGVTQYYEDRMQGGRLTMTLPSLTGGLRLGPGGPTQVWLEAGATMERTKGDSAGDSMLVAPTIGARLVRPLSPRTSLQATAEGMFFSNNIRAFSGRIGVRFEHVEAAFRVLDWNVGPALFGPELGVGF
ncbi:MAG TPA: hypothetical protein VF469_39985 [Kofleriaceae bacterium]